MNTTTQPKIGEFISDEGGFFGGAVRVNDQALGVIWAPKAEGCTKEIWLPTNTRIPGANSYADSLGNTLAMAEAGSQLAKWALGLSINGKTDWVIPARDVLELGYRHLKPTAWETACSYRDGENPSSIPFGLHYTEESPIVKTTVEAFQEGGPEAFDANWYWSSSQFSEYSAFIQYFGNGYQYDGRKSASLRARAVRLIHLNP